MALPEKEYFKLKELCKLWNCTNDDLIQYGATGKLTVYSDFQGYVIADGIYKDTFLPEKIKFGQTIGRLFNFDINFNNPIAIHSPNLDNIYGYVFKVPRKQHVKVHLQRAFRDTEQPILLELCKHYDVNIIDNYVSMLIPLNEFDHISISPNIQNWLEDINVQMSPGMEQLRKDDIKKLITKGKIQVEFLEPLKPGYFRCIAEGKNQELPWRTISELYVSRQSKNEFEKKYLSAKSPEESTSQEGLIKKDKRTTIQSEMLTALAKYLLKNGEGLGYTAFTRMLEEHSSTEPFEGFEGCTNIYLKKDRMHFTYTLEDGAEQKDDIDITSMKYHFKKAKKEPQSNKSP